MKRYEYTHLHIKDVEAYVGNTLCINTDMIDELNKLGKEGWDLAGTVNLQQQDGRVFELLFILKREL